MRIADTAAAQTPAAMVLIPLPMTQPGRYFAAALQGVVGVNRLWLQEMRAAGTPVPPLYKSGIVYKEEKNEAFCPIPAVQMRGWGDCDDLAAWRAAELNEAGETGARAVVRKSRSGVPGRWHAVVRRADGTEEDPSLRCGMPNGKMRYQINPQDAAVGAEATVYIKAPGGRKVGAASDDWRDAMSLAAAEMARLHRIGLVRLNKQQSQSMMALRAAGNPAFREAAKIAVASGLLNATGAAAALAIDKAVDFIPGGSTAREVTHAALNAFRSVPALRKLLPSFLK